MAVNLGALSEIEPAQAAGAVGVGLFRTEFLFMERPTLPTEDEQVAVYSQLLERFRPQPVVIRTLDSAATSRSARSHFLKRKIRSWVGGASACA